MSCSDEMRSKQEDNCGCRVVDEVSPSEGGGRVNAVEREFLASELCCVVMFPERDFNVALTAP